MAKLGERGAGRGRWIAIVAVALLACSIPEGSRFSGQEELECENALAHLARCCPGFQPRDTQLCFNGNVEDGPPPAFSVKQSQCVQEQSCDAVHASGLCERVATLDRCHPMDPSSGSGGGGGTGGRKQGFNYFYCPEHVTVCP